MRRHLKVSGRWGMKGPPPSPRGRALLCAVSVPSGARSLLQAERWTCEDFQDEGHSSASPNSSFSPFDGDLTTTSSSLFIDSLTTEGKS